MINLPVDKETVFPAEFQESMICEVHRIRSYTPVSGNITRSSRYLFSSVGEFRIVSLEHPVSLFTDLDFTYAFFVVAGYCNI